MFLLTLDLTFSERVMNMHVLFLIGLILWILHHFESLFSIKSNDRANLNNQEEKQRINLKIRTKSASAAPLSPGNNLGNHSELFIQKNSKKFYPCDWVCSLGRYYPSHDPSHDSYSRMILKLKDRNPIFIDAFSGFVWGEMVYIHNPQLCLCVVPSSQAWSETCISGMGLLVNNISERAGSTVATKCLRRTRSITAAHRGGRRSISEHLDTITVYNPALIKGKKVYLFDDIRTTGASLEACKELLEDAGASSVFGVVLAQTQRTW